jgi:osmotically inducible protein OsmC
MADGAGKNPNLLPRNDLAIKPVQSASLQPSQVCPNCSANLQHNHCGTNPEELIAAAHAGCFSMALSAQLGSAGMTADSIDTKATLTLDKTEAGFTITSVHLDVKVKIPGADQAKFDEAAQNAKKGCPVSRVLNASITMDAQLVS